MLICCPPPGDCKIRSLMHNLYPLLLVVVAVLLLLLLLLLLLPILPILLLMVVLLLLLLLPILPMLLLQLLQLLQLLLLYTTTASVTRLQASFFRQHSFKHRTRKQHSSVKTRYVFNHFSSFFIVYLLFKCRFVP